MYRALPDLWDHQANQDYSEHKAHRVPQVLRGIVEYVASKVQLATMGSLVMMELMADLGAQELRGYQVTLVTKGYKDPL